MKSRNVFEGFSSVLDKLTTDKSLDCFSLYIISKLKDHIKMSLKELVAVGDNDFANGEIYAYVECLELILILSGVKPKKLIKLERKYGII